MNTFLAGTASLTAMSVGIQASAVIAIVVYVLILTALAGVVLTLVTDDRDPSTVIAWLLLILLVPLFGVVLYFFIGRNYRRGSAHRDAERERQSTLAANALAPTYSASEGFTRSATAALATSPGARIEAIGRHEGLVPLLPADSVEVFVAGAEKFPRLISDMASARSYIHLMYLIWEQDELTARVTDVLLDRLEAGVEVHIIYDWLSCVTYRKDELKRLAAAGATVVPCYRRLPHINYRNHMKMAIIDGAIVYTGGMNMGQEYIDGGRRFATWRDTHLRMTGPIVAPFIALYATTWIENGRSEDLASDYVHEPVVHRAGHGTPVQMLHSSVSTRAKTIRDAFITALLASQQRVWIQSPYFVPDEPLITAMCVAAASKIDVRFMMTGVPDKRIPWWVAQAYYAPLLEAGVKVYQYTAGFLHAKTVTVDDDLCIIGTCNWDIRSIILHDEVVAVIYDDGIASTYARQYELDMAHCRRITDDDLATWGRGVRLRNSVLRLFSRLL